MTNHPTWLPKRAIGPVYITIGLGVLAVLYLAYQAIFGADERAATSAQDDLTQRVQTLCAQTPPPREVQGIAGPVAGRVHGGDGCMWQPPGQGREPVRLAHSPLTLAQHHDSAGGPNSTTTSPRGLPVEISDSALYCMAAFDDRLGHYFEVTIAKTDDPACTRVGTVAGELADVLIK